ncbi:hypothetical protein GA0115245_14282 [Streptomyces sp. di188]|nr:hypothetical protein GA0115238_10332 [Streptomyces sp. di50b]SCE47007.1 hypothetical protein GA0115245_14282 [Streptomyces sp. di188]
MVINESCLAQLQILNAPNASEVVVIRVSGKRRRTRRKVTGELREDLQVILRIQVVSVPVLQWLHTHVLH